MLTSIMLTNILTNIRDNKAVLFEIKFSLFKNYKCILSKSNMVKPSWAVITVRKRPRMWYFMFFICNKKIYTTAFLSHFQVLGYAQNRTTHLLEIRLHCVDYLGSCHSPFITGTPNPYTYLMILYSEYVKWFILLSFIFLVQWLCLASF